MRLIDADALIGALHNHAFLEGDDRSICYNIIQKQTTVDAVPVVRCKDCKYYEETDETIGTCLLTESGAHVKGYCSWAERKEE